MPRIYDPSRVQIDADPFMTKAAQRAPDAPAQSGYEKAERNLGAVAKTTGAIDDIVKSGVGQAGVHSLEGLWDKAKDLDWSSLAGDALREEQAAKGEGQGLVDEMHRIVSNDTNAGQETVNWSPSEAKPVYDARFSLGDDPNLPPGARPWEDNPAGGYIIDKPDGSREFHEANGTLAVRWPAKEKDRGPLHPALPVASLALFESSSNIRDQLTPEELKALEYYKRVRAAAPMQGGDGEGGGAVSQENLKREADRKIVELSDLAEKRWEEKSRVGVPPIAPKQSAGLDVPSMAPMSQPAAPPPPAAPAAPAPAAAPAVTPDDQAKLATLGDDELNTLLSRLEKLVGSSGDPKAMQRLAAARQALAGRQQQSEAEPEDTPLVIPDGNLTVEELEALATQADTPEEQAAVRRAVARARQGGIMGFMGNYQDYQDKAAERVSKAFPRAKDEAALITARARAEAAEATRAIQEERVKLEEARVKVAEAKNEIDRKRYEQEVKESDARIKQIVDLLDPKSKEILARAGLLGAQKKEIEELTPAKKTLLEAEGKTEVQKAAKIAQDIATEIAKAKAAWKAGGGKGKFKPDPNLLAKVNAGKKAMYEMDSDLRNTLYPDRDKADNAVANVEKEIAELEAVPVPREEPVKVAGMSVDERKAIKSRHEKWEDEKAAYDNAQAALKQKRAELTTKQTAAERARKAVIDREAELDKKLEPLVKQAWAHVETSLGMPEDAPVDGGEPSAPPSTAPARPAPKPAASSKPKAKGVTPPPGVGKGDVFEANGAKWEVRADGLAYKI